MLWPLFCGELLKHTQTPECYFLGFSGPDHIIMRPHQSLTDRFGGCSPHFIPFTWIIKRIILNDSLVKMYKILSWLGSTVLQEFTVSPLSNKVLELNLDFWVFLGGFSMFSLCGLSMCTLVPFHSLRGVKRIAARTVQESWRRASHRSSTFHWKVKWGKRRKQNFHRQT